MVQGVLTHEMIHMFDACRHEMDFKDMHHLACTEIRAANLTHCSFMSAMAQVRYTYFFGIIVIEPRIVQRTEFEIKEC